MIKNDVSGVSYTHTMGTTAEEVESRHVQWKPRQWGRVM